MNRVKDFLSNYENPGTKKNLKAALKLFFQSIYEEASLDNLDIIAEKYFSTQRDYEKDLQYFVKSLNGMAPLTVKHKVSCIKTFLLENGVEIPQKFWKKVSRRIKGSRALTLDRIPTTGEFKKLLLHMPIQGKALFFTLESSGMRMGEALGSNIDDLYLNDNPARVQIRGEVTKTGNSRHAFISREAKEAVEEWLKVREGYLKSAIGKSHLYDKDAEDNRIFPFDPTTAYSMWKKALHKSGLNGKDKSTGREKVHPHTLRKFFRTRLGAAGIPIDVVEALMGHEGYLTEVYRRYSLEDLRTFYLKGESALLVFTEAGEVIKLRQEVEERNKTLNDLIVTLSAKSERLETENREMKDKVASIELENIKLKEDVHKLSSRVDSIIETKVNSLLKKLDNLSKK